MHSYSPYPRLPSKSSISTFSAATRSDPWSRPMLLLMLAYAFPLPSQSRRMHSMQTSQAKIHEMSYCSPQMRLFVWGFCSVENINLVPHSLLPSITTMGPFPCTFTLRFRPVITMKDHFTLRYPLAQFRCNDDVDELICSFLNHVCPALSFFLIPSSCTNYIWRILSRRNSTAFVENLCQNSIT